MIYRVSFAVEESSTGSDFVKGVNAFLTAASDPSRATAPWVAAVAASLAVARAASCFLFLDVSGFGDSKEVKG